MHVSVLICSGVTLPRLASLPVALLLTAGLFWMISPAHAGTAIMFVPNALGVEDNAADTGAGSYSLGYEFSVSSPITVTSLGFFNDPSFDPSVPFNSVTLNPTPTGTYIYVDSHAVGIYALNGTLPLLSGTVTAASAPDGDFLYTSALTGVPVLPAGTYIIAGVTGSADPYVYDVQTSDGLNYGFTTGSGISYVQDEYAVSSVLTNPSSTDTGSEPGFFGPNFQYTPDMSPAPEPAPAATLGLVSLGLTGLLLRARRMKTRRRA